MYHFIHLHFLHVRKIFFIVLLLFTVSLEVNAGTVPPDPGGDPSGGGGTPVGGGAPIGNGTYILIGAALAYSLWKTQKKRSTTLQRE